MPVSETEPECLRLCFDPQGNGHSWEDMRQCCCPCSVGCFFWWVLKQRGFFCQLHMSHKFSTFLFSCSFFFFFSFRRESARGRREGEMSYKGCNILFCRVWFVVAFAIKRKTMFVYCCSYSISSSSGTDSTAFSKKEYFAAVSLMSICAFEYIKFSVE